MSVQEEINAFNAKYNYVKLELLKYLITRDKSIKSCTFSPDKDFTTDTKEVALQKLIDKLDGKPLGSNLDVAIIR